VSDWTEMMVTLFGVPISTILMFNNMNNGQRNITGNQ